MRKNHFKMFSFLRKLVILFQLVYSINHRFGAEASTQTELHDRLSKIEAQNRNHENEISVLKTEKVEDREEIHQLRERVALLESSTFSNSSASGENLKRSKRPARLLPANILRPKKKIIENEENKRFYGPPTSCDELNKLGYTLNGYYLIKGKEKLNANRIQVVYCQFQQPPGAKKQSFETLIGNVEVKTKGVHFYVQRDTKFSDPGILTFNVEQLNIGRAMNMTTGEFTAPVDGIYHFEFRCLKDRDLLVDSGYFLQVRQKGPLTVVTSLGVGPNESHLIAAGTHMANHFYQVHVSGSITASLKLKANDVLNLYSHMSVSLHDDGSHYTQFAGWLVEEDLMLA